MISRRHLLGTAGGALAAPFVLRRAWAQEFALTVRANTGSPAEDDLIETWVERIEDQSDDRIAITVEEPEGLADEDLIALARDGTVDIAWAANTYRAGRLPRTEVFELPGVSKSDLVAVSLAMRELFDAHLAADYEGLHVLLLHVQAGNGIHMVDTPIRAVADIAGTLMRVPTRTAVWVTEVLGATPVVTGPSDFRRSLYTELAAGCLVPWDIIPSLDLQDLTQYQIEGPGRERFGTTASQMSMNRETWESLPQDLQEIITRNAGEDFLREVREGWRDAEQAGIEAAIEAGNELITLTEVEMQAFRTAMEPVSQRWIDEVAAAGVDGQALLDAAKAAITRHSTEL